MFAQHYAALAIFAITMVYTAYGSNLIGDHICTRSEKYTVTYEKHIKRNMTRREYVWCASFPPRCSKYITKEIDDIKVVEEERIKKIDICCEGYVEDKTQTYCIPDCKSCVHGICTTPETCSCIAGFTGSSCNQSCDAGSWGQNCAFLCACARGGPCQPETGNCICEPGTTGSKCEISIYPASPNCTFKNCNKTYITPEIMNKTKEHDVIDEKNFTFTTEEVTTTKMPSTIKPETSTHPQKKKEQSEITNHTSDHNTLVTQPVATDPVESSKKNFNFTGKIHPFSDKSPEHWHMAEIMIKNNDSSSIKETLLVFIISIAVGIGIILVLVAVMSIMIARYKKQRDLAIENVLNIKSNTDNNRNRLSTEPIIQRSVFHAPLPDPPIFQNPVFSLRESENVRQIQYNNFSGSDTQSQYDYPPSSGSYRAASLPGSELTATTEPVYDEIPASKRPRPVSVGGNCGHSDCSNAQCHWNDT